MISWPRPIERLTFETRELMAAHPPVWSHQNKQAVWEVARPAGMARGPQLRYARWRELGLPPELTLGLRMTQTLVRDSYYDYLPVPGDPDTVEWHVNFADPHLFGAYGSSLLAQDEMQVMEHPPSGRHGEYTLSEIQYVLSTAFTAFRVAGLESGYEQDRATRVGVHTGFWGCGAFGGNRVLMAMLQLLACEMAGLDFLVFHTGRPEARRDLERAREMLERLFPAKLPVAIPEAIARIVAQKFRWGVSDGN
jgi:hypothetical protein